MRVPSPVLAVGVAAAAAAAAARGFCPAALCVWYNSGGYCM